MFLSPAAFMESFNPEVHLQPSELEVYRARAKVAKQRFDWSPALYPLFRNCLIHRSFNVPGKVAYYASIPNLMVNRVTRTSPEMFLERALAQAPSEIQTAWMTEVLGQVLPELHFINNDDPDGWYHTYDNGPHSCMEGSHLVEQYACPGNNLALVFATEDNDPEGPITYRVIVNKLRMTYLRIYGAEDEKNFFVAALNKAGYTSSGDTLNGELIRLNYSPCQSCGDDVLVGPYFDGGYDQVQYVEHGIGRIGNKGSKVVHCVDEVLCGCSNEDDDEY